MTSDSPLGNVLSRLANPKKSGAGWQARCPAHEDKNPSLSVSEGDDGRVLIHCHVGCETQAVVEAIGLTMADLMPHDDNGRGSGSKAEPRIVATYDYPDAAGTLLYQVVRYVPKTFKQRRPDGAGGWHWSVGNVQRVLYRLPELLTADPSVWVFICEGEKDVDRLRSLGLVGTCNSGGAGKWRHVDDSPLRGRRCCVVSDADKPGRAHAADVAKRLHGLAGTVRVLELPGPGKDASEWLDAGGTAEELVAMAEAEPESAIHALAFQPFPLDALPHGVREYVAAVARATSTDHAYAAVSVLVTAAGCIGNRVAVQMLHGWSEAAVLWGACIGRSGSIKSAVLKLVTRPLVEAYKAKRAVFAEATRDYAVAQQRYAVDLAAWKAAQKSGPPTDPPLPPDPPREDRVLISDITVEKLGCLLSQNPLGLLVVRDELAGWIGAFDRYSGGRGSDRPAWLSMHDASPLTVDRKSQDGSLFVERAAVSVLGCIQPGTLARVFGCEERESGLLARVLLAYPPARPVRWTDDGLPDHLAARWQAIVDGILELTPAEDATGDPRPRVLTIGPDAKPAWARWHDAHMEELADLDDDDLAAAFSKLKGACVRFALVLACIELVERGGSVGTIDADCMARAIRITEWFKGEARRVYGLLAEGGEDRAARRLLELIERKGGTVTARDVTHSSREYSTSAEAEAALGELVNAGLGEWEREAPGPRGGRPSKRFRLVSKTPSQTPVSTVSKTKTTAPDPASGGFGYGDNGDTPKSGGSGDAENDANDAGWRDFE